MTDDVFVSGRGNDQRHRRPRGYAIQRCMEPRVFADHFEAEHDERVELLRALPRGDDDDFTPGRETEDDDE